MRPALPITTTTSALLLSALLLPLFPFPFPLPFAHAHTPSYKSPLSPQALLAPLNGSTLTINSIPPSTRAHWMREANRASATLSGPCAFAAFGAVVVNHTRGSGLGRLVCMGANANARTGDPTLHGEIAAIANCSRVLTDAKGPYNLTSGAALAAFADLSLYTNAESCPMCASAIRWANFKEYIYGTSIDYLIAKGWGQIRISSLEVFRESFDFSVATRLIGDVLTNETDPLFSWQFDSSYPCPKGCARSLDGTSCVVKS